MKVGEKERKLFQIPIEQRGYIPTGEREISRGEPQRYGGCTNG